MKVKVIHQIKKKVSYIASFKVCFGCKRKLPLFMFTRNYGKYVLKTDFGRNRCCRLCEFRKSKNNLVVRRINGKFELKRLSLKERFLELWKS